ncbi:MAG: hypothetical protein HND53_13235 [Proteobacteria bacterium]|nr:hypothetical protein [Pseudomonadota bacterium]NOG61460.1 hypothetical protein [Pseudomonadota bacterium]
MFLSLKNTPKLFIGLLTVVFLAGCSEKQVGNLYFPLQKDLSWTYTVTTEYPDDVTQSELTITNVGKQYFDDKPYFVRRTSSGIDYYLNHDETGVYREGLRTLVEMKPRLDRERRYVLKTPLLIGTDWNEITRPLLLLRVHPYRERVGKKSQVPLSYRIESVTDSVTVAAGKFENCIKVVAEGKIEIYTDAVNGYTDIPINTEEWYAPGVGLVKQIRYELYDQVIEGMNTPIFIGGKTTLELQSYNK